MEIVLVEASSFSDQQSVPEDHPSLQSSRAEDAAVPGFLDEAAVIDQNRRANIVLPSLEKPYNRIPPGAATQARPLSGVMNPAPVYPALARKQGWEGTVLVRVLVQADGLPGQVMVEKSSGHQVLDSAASETIRQWKFEPAGRGSRDQASWVAIPVRFALVDE
jgi:protein TonB